MREQETSLVTLADGNRARLITGHAPALEVLTTPTTSSFLAAPRYPQSTPAVSKATKQRQGCHPPPGPRR
ncbi:hypothetical protein [Glycomyces tenuis]|uniref:hypothetical protein n=1 Tax=Glycomyces tenuis TaxID=58116 RepID=UPI0003FA0E4F|nr:hypothetical protein [Glycomyces tenuis]